MNRVFVATEILKVARELLAVEFDTEKEKKKYQQEHEVRPETKLTVKKKVGPQAEAVPRQSPEQKGPRRVDFSMEDSRQVFVNNHKKFFRSGDEDRKVMADHGMNKAWQDAIMDSVAKYTDRYYKDLNGCLRRDNCEDDEYLSRKRIDEYLTVMPKVPPDIPVYRGLRLDTKTVNHWLGNLQQGDEVPFSDSAFTSTSLSPTIARDFSVGKRKPGEVYVMFRIKTSHGVALGDFVSVNEKEAEVMLPRKAKLKLTGYSFMAAKSGKQEEALSRDSIVVFDVVDDEEQSA